MAGCSAAWFISSHVVLLAVIFGVLSYFSVIQIGPPAPGFDANLFVYHPEVRRALDDGYPVVALESTIISHGMPYPQNVETARQVERVVRQGGAVPATIAILHGKVHIGLSNTDLDTLGRAGLAAHKTSRRDVAYVLSHKQLMGATTVSATMLLAHRAGIHVFATGGIGGVHRGASTSMDISADLTELGRTPITVVCAGAKSILDLGLTLEYLETQGVTVIGYQTDMLPAFFVRESNFPVPLRINATQEIARLIDNNYRMALGSGMVVTCPVPEASAADANEIQTAIDAALEAAETNGIQGKATTPFLLDAINRATKGKSLEANIELVKNNARIAAEIALEYATLRRKNIG